MDLVDTAKCAENVDGEQIHPETVCNTYTWSSLGIESTQSGFKVVGFTKSKKGQAGELVGDKEFMAYLADKAIVLNNNGILFKNNVEYIWAKFMQDSKIIKESMGMFSNNPDLALIWEYLSYQSVNSMRALLTELLYGKVIWWTKRINIYLIITDMASKKYFIYDLDIILAIRFLIGYRSFA